MAEPSKKKRKVASTLEQPVIVDSRFSKFQSDSRYRLPSKKHNIKLDRRFGGLIKDEEFTRRARVDRYGRSIDHSGEKKRFQKRYEFEEEEPPQDESDADDDADIQRELQRVDKSDPLRNGRESATSSDDSSSEEESDVGEEEVTFPAAQGGDIPKGEVTSRLAVVNLDWDNIRASDLMAVFTSFTPPANRLLKVSVYPSDFGRERIEKEEREGPPQDIFSGQPDDYSDSEAGSDDHGNEEKIKEAILQPDRGDEFDPAKLRQYQLERLQYYFAILEFSSSNAAKAVYDAADGTEYLSTANFFDLRFVPDGTDFTSDIARDECTSVPAGYKPNEFVTDVLQHSKVKLTWDADDVSRKEAQARAFRGSRKDIDENDLKAYLGTDSSESESEADQAISKKVQERQKMRKLLGLGEEPATKLKKGVSEQPLGDLQITFSSALSSGHNKKISVFENDPEPNETTIEKYVRKERERKQQRKAKLKTSLPIEVEESTEDAGFEDPFFTEPSNDKAAISKLRKEDRLKRRAEREADEKAAATKRAELELMMVDDKDVQVAHFNINDIEKAERRAKKKTKKGHKDKQKEEVRLDDGFNVAVEDPRWAKLYESHELAIDPTHPRFMKTQAMTQLLEEGRKRRKGQREGVGDDPSVSNARHSRPHAAGDGVDVQRLVEKVKRQR